MNGLLVIYDVPKTPRSIYCTSTFSFYSDRRPAMFSLFLEFAAFFGERGFRSIVWTTELL